MSKIQKTQALKKTTFILACVLCQTAFSQITVNVRSDLPAKNELTKSTYGSGFTYQNADMRVMFEDKYWNNTPANSLNSYNMLKGLNFGIFRFPGGDPSSLYRWDKPCGSVNAPAPDCSEYMSMSDMQKYFVATATAAGQTYRTPLGAQAMYQINSFQSWTTNASGQTIWKTVYQKREWYDTATQQWRSEPIKQNGLYLIDTDGLKQAADVAANWVTENRKNNPISQQAQYWEIGNEDWIRWTPEQYAKIFSVIANAMIAANNNPALNNGKNAPLKLIAQTTVLARDYTQLPSSTDPNNLAINQTAGSGFPSLFADELVRLNFPLNGVYGFAAHPYINGERSPDVNTRTLTMFSKASGGEFGTIRAAVGVLNITKGTTWRVLTTEYNVLEFLEKDTNGNEIPSQNKSHALVLADWTASMLYQGAGNVFPHTLDAHPKLGLMLYRNGGTLSTPVLTAPGAALSKLIAKLQGTMYSIEDSAGTINFTDANGTAKSVKSMSSYATVSGSKMNVLLVNRNLTQPQTVTLKITGSKKFATGGSFVQTAFGEGRSLLDDNTSGNNVAWGPSQTYAYTQTCKVVSNPTTECKLNTNINVPAGTMVHIEVPLQ